MSYTDSPPDKPPVRIWRRIGLALGAIVVILAVVGFVSNYLDVTRTRATLRQLEQHLDETDPDWRLADLEKARDEIPPEENSAVLIVHVARLLPRNWPAEPFYKHFDSVHLVAPHQLDKEQIAILDAEMKNLAATLTEARRLADMPRGRHFLEVKFNPISTLLTDQQNGRQSASLLSYDAIDLAQKGDIDGALRSSRGCINAGRSIGDEPFMISALIRIACVAIGCDKIERALSQGEASDKALAAVQALLKMEDEHPTMRVASRGERAMSYDLITKMVDGRISAADMMATGERATLWERVFGMGISRKEPGHSLRIMTRVVESTRLPEVQQAEEQNRIEAEVNNMGREALLTKMLMPAAGKVGDACRRKSSQVRSLMTAVAAERFRLENKKWPDTLEQLTPKYLPTVPVDPFDGKPLRYKKLADGVVVYSVGADRKDDGGLVARYGLTPGTDQGYRLWDVKSRRQPPLPRPKPPEAEGEMPGDGPPP